MSILSEDLENKAFSITERDLIEDCWRPFSTKIGYDEYCPSFMKCIILNDVIRGYFEIFKEGNSDKWRLNCYDNAYSTQDIYASYTVNSMENLIGYVKRFIFKMQ